MEHIAQKLKELRKRKGLSLQELSYKVGISVATLSRIETNPEHTDLVVLTFLLTFMAFPLKNYFHSVKTNKKIYPN